MKDGLVYVGHGDYDWLDGWSILLHLERSQRMAENL
jgi:hypothetical protein